MDYFQSIAQAERNGDWREFSTPVLEQQLYANEWRLKLCLNPEQAPDIRFIIKNIENELSTRGVTLQ